MRREGLELGEVTWKRRRSFFCFDYDKEDDELEEEEEGLGEGNLHLRLCIFFYNKARSQLLFFSRDLRYLSPYRILHSRPGRNPFPSLPTHGMVFVTNSTFCD